jgi:hypothetical protein
MKNYFPDNMKNTSETLTCESIASKLSIFYEQVHLFHLQTTSYAEHMALGAFYEYIGCFKDDTLEKIMGYKGMRLKSYSLGGDLKSHTPGASEALVEEIKVFAYALQMFAGEYHMPDIENTAQELSGQAAKTLYLLTLT